MQNVFSATEVAVMWAFAGIIALWAVKMLTVPMVTHVHGWRASTAIALVLGCIGGLQAFLVFAGAAVFVECLLWYLDPPGAYHRG